MAYRLSRKEMRILIESRNESEELYKNSPKSKTNTISVIKGVLMMTGALIALLLSSYFLFWLGNYVGGAQ